MEQEETTEKLRLDVCKKLDGLRSELNELNDSVNYAKEEIVEAREKFDAVKTCVDQLLGRNVKLERSLDEAKTTVDLLSQPNDELRREVADAQLIAERLKTALDAALNDVAIYRRAAFWFAVSSLLAVVALVAALGK